MQDSKLIFLLSLPRSGSTMTQKILGAHSEIYTCSEPWLLLNPLSGIKGQGTWANYNHTLATKASQEFINNIPDGGKEIYYKSLRNCYCELYSSYLEKENKSHFLDKTPRYYNILPELLNIFPRAKVILLYRNPLATLVSIIDTWVKPGLSQFSAYRNDLIDGVDILSKHSLDYENVIKVTYENLIAYPEETIGALCDYIELPFEQSMLDYGVINGSKWSLGDQDTVYSMTEPNSKYQNKWIEKLSDPDIWHIACQYMEFIGKEKFESLGYDYKLNQKILRQNTPVDISSDLDLFKLLFGQQSWPSNISVNGEEKIVKDNDISTHSDTVYERVINFSRQHDELDFVKQNMADLSKEFNLLKNDYNKIVKSHGIGRMLTLSTSLLRLLISDRKKNIQ